MNPSAHEERSLVLTMGEPASIAPLLTLKAWLGRDKSCPFFVVGDPELYRYRASHYGIDDVPIRTISSPLEARSHFDDGLPVLPLPTPVPHGSSIGIPQADNQNSVRASIDIALALLLQGDASAMVTLPIHKKSLQVTGWNAAGHTDYIEHFLQKESPSFNGQAVMMLASPLLRVVPVTIHCSLKDAITQLTEKKIIDCVTILHKSLREDFAIPHPRLAMAGLNPHGGEEGLWGDEEARIIAPALQELKKRDIDCRGIFAADGLFIEEQLKKYDAFIGMYHDQVLIPFKALSFHDGVNVTLGLPIIRTSPDHGTAFGLAEKGDADERSLKAAIFLAHEMVIHRMAL